MTASLGILWGLVKAEIDTFVGCKTAAHESHSATTNGRACLRNYTNSEESKANLMECIRFLKTFERSGMAEISPTSGHLSYLEHSRDIRIYY